MSSSYSRRRFLTDLLFVGGVLAVSAGLAVTGAESEQTPPAPVTPACETESGGCATKSPERAMPGDYLAPSTPVASPGRMPVRPSPPPMVPEGRRLPAPPKNSYTTGGKPMAPPPHNGPPRSP